MAQVYVRAGYECIVVGQCKTEPGSFIRFGPHFMGYSIYDPSVGHGIKEKLRVFLFMKRTIVSALRKVAQDIGGASEIAAICIYQQLSPPTTRYIMRYCKRNGIKLFFDIVEFQTISQQSLFTFFQFYLPNWMTVKRFSKKAKTLAISTYLSNLLNGQKSKAMYVPFFFNMEEANIDEGKSLRLQDGTIELVYAGCPSRGRDSLANVIKGLACLNEKERAQFHLTIAGANEEQIKALGLSEKELKQSLSHCSYLGTVPHEEALNLIKRAAFTLYMKPAKKRFSKAGFPTKVSESLMMSTPVIFNLSGDVGVYLQDGQNAIECRNDSPLAFAEGLRKVLALDQTKYISMARNAFATAKEKLSIEHFEKPICDFLELGRNNEESQR